MKITLELHKEGNSLLLNSQDIYEYVGETTDADFVLAYYIDKWCEYLNYPLIHNNEMKFGDPEKTRLEGWLSGFNFAKRVDVKMEGGVVILRYGKHKIILNKPFEI